MRKSLIILLLIIITISISVFILKDNVLSPKITNYDKTKIVEEFNKSKYSITEPTSIWVIANKNRAIQPASYLPTDLVTPNIPVNGSPNNDKNKLRIVVSDALVAMVNDALKSDIKLKLASGYRSYNTQVSVYNNEVRQYGKAVADTESARPGHSEHQLGLALDIQDANGQCVIAECFKDLPEGIWVANNAYKYGFIIRYPVGKQEITGYKYEPWHLRYVGVELATEMHSKNIQTLEEFFNVVEKIPY